MADMGVCSQRIPAKQKLLCGPDHSCCFFLWRTEQDANIPTAVSNQSPPRKCSKGSLGMRGRHLCLEGFVCCDGTSAETAINQETEETTKRVTVPPPQVCCSVRYQCAGISLIWSF